MIDLFASTGSIGEPIYFVVERDMNEFFEFYEFYCYFVVLENLFY